MGKYWDNINEIQAKQTAKGIGKYGQVLEENTKMTPLERITYLEEELIDGLMYCEHLKTLIKVGQTAGPDISANNYQQAAMRTMRPTSEVDPLLNGALGLAGESGEVADHIKKCHFQGHKLDKEHLIKELGDIAWYLATTAAGLNVDLSTIFTLNIEKLRKRYPNGFDANRSINRPEDNHGTKDPINYN